MSSHLATERLSAYLDDELPTGDAERVEAHVLECPHCQHRLSGLRRVVDELRRVPAAPPPPMLARSVQLEVSSRWRARREEARRGRVEGGFELLQGPIRLGFAMVAGLAIILFLYVEWASRESTPGTRIVVPPARHAVESAERIEAGGRVFVEAGGAWWQEDLLAAADPGAQGTDSNRAAAVAMLPDDALARAPWLADVLARGQVVVELDGATVVVDARQPPAGSTDTTR